MEENTVNCLFCALPCSPDFVINSSSRVKSEKESNSLEEDDSYNFPFNGVSSSLPHSISFGGDDKAIEEHLRAVFILTKILKIPYQTLCQFLGKGNGQFSPEMWFNVCESCGNSVTKFYVTLKQLSKLERRLASLQTQFIDKMRTSQDVENNDFVWRQIREEALQQFSASPPTCDEEIELETQMHFQNADENWNSENNHDELNQEGTNESSYTQPDANESFEEEENYSNFENDNHDDEEEDEKDEIHFVTDFVPPPPPPSTKRYFYRCQLCSFQCNTKKDFEAHMKLHEEGSGAIICSDCGRPVLPNKLRWHVGQCRAGIVGNYGYKKGPRRDSNSNLPKPPGKFYYQCGQCPFETNSNVRYASHLELHGEGSTAVVCRECGYFVEPSQLSRHKVLRHSANRKGRGSVKEQKKKSVKTHRDEDEEWK